MEITTDEFLYIFHGGHEEGKPPPIFRSSGNTREVLKTVVKSRCNCIEVDVAKTADGTLVLAHPPLFGKGLEEITSEEYLEEAKDTLSFEDFCQWMLEQDINFKALVEIKGDINFQEISDIVSEFHTEDNALLERIMLYTVPTSGKTAIALGKRERILASPAWKRMVNLLEQKQVAGFSTEQLPIGYTLNTPLSYKVIDEVLSYGTQGCRFGFIVHGVLWGQEAFSTQKWIRDLTSKITIGNIERLKKVVAYAHEKGLMVIFGTVDKQFVEPLRKTGVDGITINNPEDPAE
jgi:glycerophosphoryl diester phosphodiesterase